MKEQKEILELLADNRILHVLIGGYAMRIYNSPRITHDIDLAIRTLDVDAIEDLLTLKKDRKNKSASDIADIEFLEVLLKGKGEV